MFYQKDNQQYDVSLRVLCVGSILCGWLGKADF